MPIFKLTHELVFPDPTLASKDGVLAIGGDLRPERLLLAYSQGIFPWPSEGLPMLWFSPNPRCILEPAKIHLPHSLRKTMRKRAFDIRVDTAFHDVIESCAEAYRPGQDGTWITEELARGYEALHALGFAHSIEAWQNDKLVGGLYGVSLGRAFFGESMFAREPDASKVAFATLCANLTRWNFDFVDCQVPTEHLNRFGAVLVSRDHFLDRLHEALSVPTREGSWTFDLDSAAAADLLTRNYP